jgi:uncharacterized protein YdhG (YjbR/CyaY superfamily)
LREVHAYVARQPLDVRRRLREVRAIVRAAVPGATETFSYGIPGFKLDGRPLIWYAAWKQHTSLYPMTAAIRRAHAKALAGYETSTGTIRLPLAEPFPSALVRRLVKARAAEVRSAAKARASRARR